MTTVGDLRQATVDAMRLLRERSRGSRAAGTLERAAARLLRQNEGLWNLRDDLPIGLVHPAAGIENQV